MSGKHVVRVTEEEAEKEEGMEPQTEYPLTGTLCRPELKSVTPMPSGPFLPSHNTGDEVGAYEYLIVLNHTFKNAHYLGPTVPSGAMATQWTHENRAETPYLPPLCPGSLASMAPGSHPTPSPLI